MPEALLSTLCAFSYLIQQQPCKRSCHHSHFTDKAWRLRWTHASDRAGIWSQNPSAEPQGLSRNQLTVQWKRKAQDSGLHWALGSWEQSLGVKWCLGGKKWEQKEGGPTLWRVLTLCHALNKVSYAGCFVISFFDPGESGLTSPC